MFNIFRLLFLILRFKKRRKCKQKGHSREKWIYYTQLIIPVIIVFQNRSVRYRCLREQACMKMSALPLRIHTPPPVCLQTWHQWSSSGWGQKHHYFSGRLIHIQTVWNRVGLPRHIEYSKTIKDSVLICVSYPSRMDSLQQYRLSNFCLVTESLTFMAGTHSFPALDSWYNLHTHNKYKCK